MKKFLIALACLCLPLLASAQLQKVAIKSASCSQSQSGEEASKAIDGNLSTIWHSPYSGTSFPVSFIIQFSSKTHVDMVRYIPRTSGSNGNWDEVTLSYRSGTTGSFTEIGTYDLNGSGSAFDFELGEGGLDVRQIRFSIKSGSGNFASAAEIEAYVYDNSKQEAFENYFSDELFTVLKPEVTSAEGIEDADIKALVNNLLTDAEGYKKFRVSEYEPYRTPASLQAELKTSSQYNNYENPTGIYLKAGEECYVAVSGITTEQVGLKIKNWVENESASSCGLRNGLNKLTADTEGNVFVNYYTDNYETAPNVKVHFINAPVRGYWDQETMTNDDWKKMLAALPNDNSVIIARSQYAQLAYPVSAWKAYCPNDIDSVMTLYQNVQLAERNMMGLEKYGRQTKNRQLFYATTYGFMAAVGDGAYCIVGSLGAIMKPDDTYFDFWGVGHEWGHNNQISGFKWSGCGETTNNIYASWAQILYSGNRTTWLRLEDENSGVDEYSGMRGGRMQAYFEEGLRKGVQWQLQDGPDYHGNAPSGANNSRNYDHFVKLAPFWQMNLWGTLAGKCPDIIPMVIEGIRDTDNYTSIYNTNGKQQMNFMKLACDSAKIDLLPFFEKAGMLKPINAYIEDYGAGWNVITQDMIDDLKAHVKAKGYPAYTEEINYINGHNYKTYRDNLKLQVPAQLGTGCTYSNGFVVVQHSQVKNAVAFETYNSKDELIRITMYGLGSNDAHSYTMVLYPAGEGDEGSAYIMAVGYDGTREKIYEKENFTKAFDTTKFYTITNVGKGNALSCGTNTTISADGTINWSLARASKNSGMPQIWLVQKDASGYYVYNPQTGLYLPGKANEVFTQLVPKEKASSWEILCVDEATNKYTFKSNSLGQYLNAHSNVNTGYWSSGAGDANSCWTVEEVGTVSVTIGTTGYYLACYPMALELPEGLKAYAVGEIATLNYGGTDYDYAVLDQVEGECVPAGMPVLLNGARGTYKLSLRADNTADVNMTNLLRGTTLRLNGLTKGTVMNSLSASSEAGADATVKVAATATSVTANRAYMLMDEAGAEQVYLRTRESLSTGITDVEDADSSTEAVLYDLNGSRVSKPQSGRVYVSSKGKKVVIM